MSRSARSPASFRTVNDRLNACRASSNAGPIKGREVSGGYLSFVRFEDTPLSLAPLINELRGIEADRSIIPKRCSRDGGTMRDFTRQGTKTVRGAQYRVCPACLRIRA